MIASRRSFLFGASAFLAAPAIVRVSALMPISVPKTAWYLDDFSTDMLRVRATERYGMGYAEFRRIIEPGLRELFKDAWEVKGYRAVYGTAGQ